LGIGMWGWKKKKKEKKKIYIKKEDGVVGEKERSEGKNKRRNLIFLN